MALSRRREKELKKLKRESAELWDEQREVIDRASRVVREASRQLANVSREEVAPRVKDAFETSVAATRHVADSARTRVTRDVLPAVSGVAISHFDASDVVRHPLVQRIVRAYEQSGPI